MKISYKSIENIDKERKLELIERAILVAKEAEEILRKRYSRYQGVYSYDIDAKLSKAYDLYIKHYNESLNEYEKTLFYLYSIFPDDIKFMNLIERYDKDYIKIASFYNINPKAILLRLKFYDNLNNEKKLELKK